jgi:hypothetical protein
MGFNKKWDSNNHIINQQNHAANQQKYVTNQNNYVTNQHNYVTNQNSQLNNQNSQLNNQNSQVAHQNSQVTQQNNKKTNNFSNANQKVDIFMHNSNDNAYNSFIGTTTKNQPHFVKTGKSTIAISKNNSLND